MSYTPRMRLSKTGQGCKLRGRNQRKTKNKKERKGWWYIYGHEVFISSLHTPWSRASWVVFLVLEFGEWNVKGMEMRLMAAEVTS